MLKTLALSLVAVAACCVNSPGYAETWPSKPIKLISPFPAGGSTDQIARQIAQKLERSLAQPVVVENVLGAAGVVALEKVARSNPDGYTFVLASNTMLTLAPHLSSLPYDTLNSFVPVRTLSAFTFAVLVNSASGINNIEDLVAQARKKPGAVSAGSAGPGTAMHMGYTVLSQKAGVDFNLVAYKGTSPAMNDLMGGHIDFMLDSVSVAIPLTKGNSKLKVIATTDLKRHPMLPDVPTVAEALPNFELSGNFVMLAPAKVSGDIVQRLSDEIAKVQGSADFRQYLDSVGMLPHSVAGAELAAAIRSDHARWKTIVRSAPR